MKKPTILVFIDHFLPGFKMGGPLTSVINLIDHLNDSFEFKIITSDRDMGDTKPYPNIQTNTWIAQSNAVVNYLKSGFSKPIQILQIIRQTDADVIYLNSLLSPIFSIYIVFLNKIGLIKNKKIVISPRGETYTEALLFKKHKKQIFLKTAHIFKLYKNIYWQASSEVEKNFIISNLHIQPEKIVVAQNLTQKSSQMLQPKSPKNPTDESLKIVFLSRISKDKNIEFTFDILQNISKNIVFDIYGPIEDTFIWKKCQEKISNLPNNISVNYKGPVDKDQVKNVFSEYDLMFLPTFAENFGHVIVEALSVGTTVLLSDNTPWRDLKQKGFGWDISLQNAKAFENAIIETANLTAVEKNEKRQLIRQDFDKIINNPAILEANKNVFLIPINK